MTHSLSLCDSKQTACERCGRTCIVPVLELPNAFNAEHQHYWLRHNQHMFKFSVVDQLNRSDDHSSEMEASPCAKRNCRGVLRVFKHLQSSPTYLTLDTPCFRLVSKDSNETVNVGNPIACQRTSCCESPSSTIEPNTDL